MAATALKGGGIGLGVAKRALSRSFLTSRVPRAQLLQALALWIGLSTALEDLAGGSNAPLYTLTTMAIES